MDSKGSYEAFRGALLAFESGWDRARYDAGIIADWQLDQWAGGPVGDTFPQYTSWSQLSDAEWESMAYRSMNTLGFVGYQFGEALLIDLGYYDDDFYYGNGAGSNTWDGTWTGKNGVTSLADFTTKEKQEVAIREAFGFNLQVIRDGLAQSGSSLDSLIGTTGSYVQGGQTVEVTLTLTGIMAAAHLRGAYGTLALLTGGAVSTDEYGTSILQYIEQFGGYDAPSVDEAISFYTDRLTGDEGLGTPGGGDQTGGGGQPGGAPPDDPAITAETADVVITWSWGEDRVIEGFDPATDTVFIDWIPASSLEITEQSGSIVIAVPSNRQATVLEGVTLSDLVAANIRALDATARDEIAALLDGDAGDAGGSDPGDGGPDDDQPVDGDPPTGTPGSGGPGDETPPSAGGDGEDRLLVTWNWGAVEIVTGFDPGEDVIDFGTMSAGQVAIREAADALEIEVLGNGGHIYRLGGVGAEDLTRSNLDAAEWSSILDAPGGVVDQLEPLGFIDIMA